MNTGLCGYLSTKYEKIEMKKKLLYKNWTTKCKADNQKVINRAKKGKTMRIKRQ